MTTNPLASFFAMGGYACYVWPAYAVFFIVLIADNLSPRLRRRRLLTAISARMARQAARQQRRAAPPESPPSS